MNKSEAESTLKDTSPVPTLKDVARISNVSVATASAILSGTASNTRFSDLTRDRVLAVTAELGYQPNSVARSLRRRQTDLIGLYIGYVQSDVRGPFAAAVVSGVQSACGRHDKDIVLFTGHHALQPEKLFHSLNDGRVDGVILVGPTEDPLAAMIAGSRVKAVAIANVAQSIPSVVVDDVAGGALQADYLYQRGHRHVLYRRSLITGSSILRRYKAFVERCCALGMVVYDGFSEGEGFSEIEQAIL